MHRFRVARPGSAKEKIPYFLCLLSRESKKNTAKIQKEGIVNIRIACVLAALCGTLQAQEAPAPWKHSLAGAVNLTQVALKDWAQGGEDALAWALTLNGGSTYATDKVDWNNTYKLAFGQSKLGDQDVRKTDDKISLGTTLTYKVGTYLNPYVGATMKTQFAHGYDYSGPSEVGISQFFDPAYFTQSAGVGYQPIPEVKTRLGLAMREIFTRDFNSFSDDGSTAKIEK
ncbi:MAG: hypothetical protein ACI8PG_002704, partial [Planctomycetota bacterium]